MTHRETISLATCLGRVHRSLELAKKAARQNQSARNIEHHVIQAEIALDACIRQLKKLEHILVGRDPPKI